MRQETSILSEEGIRRIGRGFYEVTLGAAVERESSVQAQATRSRTIGVRCSPTAVVGSRVQVRCALAGGRYVDSGARVIAVSGLRRRSHNRALFDVFKQSSFSATAQFDASFSEASDGSRQSFSSIAKGRYRVRLGPSAVPGGTGRSRAGLLHGRLRLRL